MGQVSSYWSKGAARAWRQSLELVLLERWKRTTVFLIVLLIPAIAVWLLIGDYAATTIRVLASIGASFIAIVVMFLWRFIELQATINAEEEALRKELDDQKETAERRRQKQDRLGEFLAPCQTC